MVRALIAVLIVAFAPAAVRAQPTSEPQPPPVDRSQFDAAFDAMVRGDFAVAAAGFQAVATGSAAPELRGAATELARLADAFVGRGARLSFGGGPGGADTLAAPVAVSEDDEPTGGRATFVVTTTMASLYSGIVLLDLLDVNDLRTGTLVVMGSTAAGVLGSLYGTRGRTMTGGMADGWRLGLFAGVGNALLLSGPFGLYRATTNASEKVQSFVLASAWGGAAAGLVITDHLRPTRAQVSVVETFGLMGTASTLLGLAMLQPDSLDSDAFLAITAVGLDGGIGAGAAFAGKLDWSHSRARLVALSAFLGALAGGGTSLLLFADSQDPDTGRLAAGITLGGLWGGFALGMHLTRGMAPDYRFRRQRSAGASALLAPTIIRGAPGLSLVGSL